MCFVIPGSPAWEGEKGDLAAAHLCLWQSDRDPGLVPGIPALTGNWLTRGMAEIQTSRGWKYTRRP